MQARRGKVKVDVIVGQPLWSNVVGSYLKSCFKICSKTICFGQSTFILASELCKAKLAYSVWRRGTSALLHYSITSAISLMLYFRTP